MPTHCNAADASKGEKGPADGERRGSRWKHKQPAEECVQALDGGATGSSEASEAAEGRLVEGNAGLDRGGSRVVTELNWLKKKTGGNGQSGHISRFGVSADQTEMDLDKGESLEMAEMESNPTENRDKEATDEEVVMETLDAEDESGCRVNLSVSHLGLTEKLRPLGVLK